MSKPIIQPSGYMSIVQSAKYANCRQSTIRAAVLSGELKAVEYGGGTQRHRFKIKPEWVDEWALAHHRAEVKSYA